MWYTKKYPKFQIPRWSVSAAPILEKYKKENLKNTRQNQEIGYYSFWP